eukprot:s5761_g3.t1
MKLAGGTSEIDGPDVSEASPGLEVWQIHAPRPASEPMEDSLRDLRLTKLASLLPSSLFTSTSIAQVAELLREVQAQRILLTVGGPMKAEPSDLVGWSSRSCPKTASPKKLSKTWLQGSAGKHRRRCPLARQLCLATIHIGRSLLVSSAIAREVLSTGSVGFLGPTSSGKTTILRAAAAALSMREQVLVVDFRSELMGVAVDACEIGLEHAVYLVPPRGAEVEEEAIQRAIEDHAPEVVVAEFTLPTSALRAAKRCTEAGVRLVCSLRCTMKAVASCLEEGACEDFPFASLVELSRKQLGAWRVYRPAADAVGALRAESAPCTPEILEEVMT